MIERQRDGKGDILESGPYNEFDAYDAIGRQLTVDNNGTSGVPRVILTSVYDAASNRTQLSATVGGTNDFKNDYTFDNMNRMTQVAQIGNGGNTVANKRANFAYNALSQFTSVERQVKPSSTWNEVATTVFSYDTLNRVTDIAHQQSSTDLFTPYSYTYDYMDRIIGITSQDGTVDYTYDKTSQLTGADYSYQTDETFAWDANGNPTGGSNSVSANNHLDSDGTYDYTYDDEGNMTLRTKISDSSTREFTWDYRNRLTNVTDKTSGGTATMSADYSYDVYDRRILKTVDPDGAGATGSTTTRYVYEDQGITRVVLQFDGSNNLTHRYLHGPAVDQLLADEDSSNALLWPATDHLGSVRDLINSSAVTQNHITYGAFGSVTSESASAVDFLMGFAGTDRDEETGASYSGERYAENGRWKSLDKSGFAGEDTNLARYVHNSPAMFIDPNGLHEEVPGQPPIKNPFDGIGHIKNPLPPPVPRPVLLDALEGKLVGMANSPEAKDEAICIAKAINYTFDNNRNVFAWPNGQTNKGYFCYQWAFAFQNAAKSESDGKLLKVELWRAEKPGSTKVHYWLMIYSPDGTQAVYVDDGFTGNGSYVHDSPPCPKGWTPIVGAAQPPSGLPGTYDSNGNLINPKNPLPSPQQDYVPIDGYDLTGMW